MGIYLENWLISLIDHLSLKLEKMQHLSNGSVDIVTKNYDEGIKA
jgi:hypothetical protein